MTDDEKNELLDKLDLPETPQELAKWTHNMMQKLGVNVGLLQQEQESYSAGQIKEKLQEIIAGFLLVAAVGDALETSFNEGGQSVEADLSESLKSFRKCVDQGTRAARSALGGDDDLKANAAVIYISFIGAASNANKLFE